MNKILLGLALLSLPASLQARSLGDRLRDMPDEEWAYQGTKVLELGLTKHCVDSGKCEEVGLPKVVCGRTPSTGCLAGWGVASGLLSAITTSIIQDYDPKAARTVARIKLVVGVGVVGWNLKVAL